jgi:hypothetical protein
MRNTLFLLVTIFSTPAIIFCQTITPIYIANDSIDISKILFINPKNGSHLKTEAKGHLIHINEAFSDTVKIIIPFKNGMQIIFDTVETKYFTDCVIDVQQNKNASPACGFITYGYGDLIRFRTTGTNCGKQYNQIQVNSIFNY